MSMAGRWTALNYAHWISLPYAGLQACNLLPLMQAYKDESLLAAYRKQMVKRIASELSYVSHMRLAIVQTPRRSSATSSATRTRASAAAAGL